MYSSFVVPNDRASLAIRRLGKSEHTAREIMNLNSGREFVLFLNIDIHTKIEFIISWAQVAGNPRRPVRCSARTI